MPTNNNQDNTDTTNSNETASNATEGDGVIPDYAPTDPRRLSLEFLRQQEANPIVYWCESFYRYNGRYYEEISEGEIKTSLTGSIEATYRQDFIEGRRQASGKKYAFNRGTLGNVLDMLKSIIRLPSDTEAPFWIVDDHADMNPDSIVVTNNHIVSLELDANGNHVTHQLTSDLFILRGVEFDYDPAAICPLFDGFLGEVFPDDEPSIEALLEYIGYSLVADTSQQKILVMIGPPRAGKGVITRLWQKLVGKANYTGPKFSQLSHTFGLQPFLGKSIAIINDARSTRRDATAIVENLLCISGEDTITIARKYRSAIETKLDMKLAIVSNEVPYFPDASGALIARFLAVKFTISFQGHENINLSQQLEEELPGIFNKVLSALQRLTERGKFIQPESGKELLNRASDMGSPVQTFVTEECRLGQELTFNKAHIWNKWNLWCDVNGIYPTNTAQFFNMLLAALPQLTQERPRNGSKARERVLRGIGNTATQNEDTNQNEDTKEDDGMPK
jgi:putative DNA primase/helicase